MRLKKSGHQLQNTDKAAGKIFSYNPLGESTVKILKRRLNKKNSGSVQWVLGMFSLLFLTVFMMFELQITAYRQASDYVEDALAASGLASALIDIERYGIDHSLVIDTPENSYEIYKSALEENLGISAGRHNYLINGEVVVDEYRIYNVVGNEVEEITRNDTGEFIYNTGIKGEMAAPNGQIIENTGVYSEISFPITGFLGVKADAHKGKLVEVNSYAK